MIRPVGVGLKSSAPIGVDGLTITTGAPARAASSAACSAMNFDRL